MVPPRPERLERPERPEPLDLAAPRGLKIDRVLEDLDREVRDALETDSRLGYFAALYRRVTYKVKEGILTPGVFDDPARMDRLDFEFASRYLDALHLWRSGHHPTACWQVAFEAAGQWRPLILQQLLVGINAHINLDLGIAAARIAPGDAIHSLESDFNKINGILAGLITLVERQIGEVSPWIALLAKLAGKDAKKSVRFSMDVARLEAWRFALALAPLSEAEQAPLIAARDREVAELGRIVLHPGFLIDALTWVIRVRESNDVRRVIGVLSEEVASVTELIQIRPG